MVADTLESNADRAELRIGENSSSADEPIDSVGTDDQSAQVTDAVDGSDSDDASPGVTRRSYWFAAAVLLVVVAALAALTGWYAYQFDGAQRSADLRGRYIQVARDGAVNLTTIDWHHADSDVHRILDSATGTFYDDFNKRSKPFLDVVNQVQSISHGTVTAAGLESANQDGAQVLVAINVVTTNAGAPQSSPRSWRMRIDVARVGNAIKISNVEFVA